MTKQELHPDLANCELARHPESLAVVTTTFYPDWYSGDLNSPDHTDKIRGDLALQLLTQSQELGHSTLVVDGGDEGSDFRSALNELDVQVLTQKERGMDPARQEAFQAAAELDQVKIIAWSEPEKISFLTPTCLWQATQAMLKEGCDLVVPARDEESFSTYPAAQVAYETRANTRFNHLLRISDLLPPNDPDLDAWFGPRIFRKEFLPYFMGRYQFEASSGAAADFHSHVNTGASNSATFFPIIRALHEGKKVGSVTIPYRHPGIQTDNEVDNPAMDDKRHIQYMSIVTASLHYIQSLRDSSNPPRQTRMTQLDNSR